MTLALQGFVKDRLGDSVHVHVGCIEHHDANIESGPNIGCYDVVLNLRTVGEPVTIGEFRDLES